MQEEVENRTVTLVISATKLTGRVLKAAVAKFLAHQKAKIAEKKRAGPVKPTGKQTVKQLVGQNQGVANIEISDKNIKDFDRVARKYGVDYAVKKDKTLSPPKYMVFFKARDADALTAAFEEYTRNTARKRQKPSLIQHLHDIQAAKDIIKPNQPLSGTIRTRCPYRPPQSCRARSGRAAHHPRRCGGKGYGEKGHYLRPL